MQEQQTLQPFQTELEQPLPQENPAGSYPLAQKVGFGTSAFLTAGVLDLTANLGPTGLLVAGIAAYIAAKHGPELYAQVRGAIPAPITSMIQDSRTKRYSKGSKRTILDRALGRFPNTEGQEEPQEPRADHQEGQPLFIPQTHIKLGRVSGQTQRLDPHIDSILGRGAIIAGNPGAGKSNLLALLASGTTSCGMSTVLVDFKREYYPLLKLHPGMLAGHASFRAEAGDAFFELNPDTAAEFADIVMSWGPYGGYLAIIDIPSYGGHPDLLGKTLAAVLNALMDWSQAHPEEERLPCLTLFDEGHNYFPQGRGMSAYPMSDETFRALQSSYNRMATGGRSYGHTLILATQRLANVAKWAIATLQIKIIMRHVEQNDLKRCKEESSAAESDLLQTLPDGYGIVIGFSQNPLLIHFDEQPGRHIAHTPSIKRAHAQRNAPRPNQRQEREIPPREREVPYAPFDTDMPDLADLPNTHTTDSHTPRSRSASSRLHQAEQVWYPGMRHTDLARTLHIKPALALSLIKQMKARHAANAAPKQHAHLQDPRPRPEPLVPVAGPKKPEPEYADAVLAWNKMSDAERARGRNGLKDALNAEGFECGENKARTYLEQIKREINKPKE